MTVITYKTQLNIAKLWYIYCSYISRHCLNTSYTKVTRNIVCRYCNLIYESASNRFS